MRYQVPADRFAAEYDPMARKADVGIEVDMGVSSLADEAAGGGWNERNCSSGEPMPTNVSGTGE